MRLSRALLLPLGGLYGLGALARRAAYRRGLVRQARLRGPVLSVGNLSLGGSGKTPVVMAIARMMCDAGRPVAVLSRGYRGTFKGTGLIVSDGERVHADAALAGDEPVMLARELPGVVVAVGRRRDQVGRMVEERFGARVHVLDDGFQHLRLARDLDLVCATIDDLADWPLPAGRLRELAGAVRFADAVLVWGAEPSIRAVRARLGHERVFGLARRVVGFFDRAGRSCPAPARAFCFCGIARPERFLEDVAARVAESAGRMVFPDHHVYAERDVAAVTQRAKALGADALVTTAKDAVRWPEQALDVPQRILKVSVSVEPEDDFRALVRRAVAARMEESGR